MGTFFVIKRDGSRIGFEIQRIINAIKRQPKRWVFKMNVFVMILHKKVSNDIFAHHQQEIDISHIQKIVENHLMASQYPQIARAYIEYRHERDMAREKRSQLTKEIEGLIEQSNVELLNENANKDAKVIPTQRDLLAGIVAKHYAKRYILPRDVVEAHEKGEIHYHDLDYSPFFPMFNCMLVDLKGMLTHGFKMGNAEIEPPKSIGTATAVTAQIIAQVASHIYGGTTINRIDEVLSPYVQLSYEKHLKNAEQWHIPEAQGYAQALIEKNVSMPSSPWNMK